MGDTEVKSAQQVPNRGHELHQELPIDFPDPLFRVLHQIIRFAIRILAILMVAVILWGVGDVMIYLAGQGHSNYWGRVLAQR